MEHPFNYQWRICFRWQNGHAEDVEIVENELGDKIDQEVMPIAA
jgi:hypothetical protein